MDNINRIELTNKIFKTGDLDTFLKDYLIWNNKDDLNYLCEEYLEYQEYYGKPFNVIYSKLETEIYARNDMEKVITDIVNYMDDNELDNWKKEYGLVQNKESEYLYTLGVGGTEINDTYITFERAKELEQKYLSQGYDDVQIEKISDNTLIKGILKIDTPFTAAQYNKKLRKIFPKLTEKQSSSVSFCAVNGHIPIEITGDNVLVVNVDKNKIMSVNKDGEIKDNVQVALLTPYQKILTEQHEWDELAKEASENQKTTQNIKQG